MSDNVQNKRHVSYSDIYWYIKNDTFPAGFTISMLKLYYNVKILDYKKAGLTKAIKRNKVRAKTLREGVRNDRYVYYK